MVKLSQRRHRRGRRRRGDFLPVDDRLTRMVESPKGQNHIRFHSLPYSFSVLTSQALLRALLVQKDVEKSEMIIKWTLPLALLVPKVYCLCLDPPLASFIDRLSRAVQIEASQIDYVSFEEESQFCDSMQGPSCHLFPDTEPNRWSLRHMNGDVLSRVLGIPAHVSVSMASGGSNKRAVGESEIVYSFRGYRLSVDEHPQFSSGELAPLPAGFASKVGPVRAQWIGPDWYYNPSTLVPYLASLRGSPTSGTHSIRFSQPIVFQELTVRPAKPSQEKLLLVGRRKGKEVWRKDLSNPLVGSQVFAKWPGNGSIFRAKVMVHEENFDNVHLAWSDGDQTYRSVGRDSILSIVPGNVENLYSVDEVILTSPTGGLFEITSMIVSAGHSDDPGVNVIRSGGGMVFEDTVSLGAVLYSAKEMVQRRFVIKRSKETEKSFNKYLDLYSAGSVRAASPMSRRSYRNYILYWIFNQKSPIVDFVAKIVTTREDLIVSYLNVNHLFTGVIDNGGDRDGWFEESFRFMSWVQSGFPVTPLRGSLSVTDTFEGQFVCIGAGTVPIRIEIVSVDQGRISDKHIDITVNIFANNSSNPLTISGEYVSQVGMLYIPASREWKYPLTLFLTRRNTFLVELMGTVEYEGCGAVFMGGTRVGETTRSSMTFIDDSSLLIETLKKFNAVLLKNKDAVTGPRKAFHVNFH